MSQYHFTITISGNGTDEQEAWLDACEGFTLDPGIPDAERIEIIPTDD